MPDNLSINIVATSDKARAELELLNAKIRQTRSEVRQLTNEAQRTGGGRMTPEILATTHALQGYEAQARASSRATIAHAEANVVTSRTFREVTKTVGELTHAAGLGIPGMRALRLGIVALAGVEVVRAVKSGIDSLNDLNNAAKAIRADPRALRSMEQSFEQVGQSASDARTMMDTFNKAWDQSRLQQIQRGGTVPGTSALRGGRGQQPTSLFEFLHVGRGGVQPPTLEEAMGADPLRFVLGREVSKDRAADMQKAAQQIAAIKDPTIANAIAQKIFNLTIEQVRTQLDQLSQNKLPEVKGQTEAQKQSLGAINKDTADIAAQMGDINQNFALVAAETARSVANLNNIKAALSGAAATQAMEASALPLSNAPAPVEAGLQASGGLIRGPGSGTSDSIPAWLSNGEYVINAASVRRLGTGFLHSLNSFALGGLVGPPAMRFAAGGLAASSGAGTPVNLHIGGGVFPTSATPAVAHALVIEAKRQQMSSAGVKPSWYGR